jgi:16S rRNA (guanine527-N7)-methyltransferase
MENIFKEKGIILSSEQKDKFEIFREILLFYNDKFNLTSIKEKRDIYVKHFLDSVIAKDFYMDKSSVIEIGSGGGFPSIPLMIVRNDLKFTLLEATGKKCIFLKEALKALKITDCEVLNGRAEDFGKDNAFREKFDHSTARAVARLNSLCEYCLPFIKVDGSFIALKGNAEEEINESKNAVKVLGGKISKVKTYELPFEEGNRTVIEITKINKTPSLYPRGNGKERKNPL